MVENGGRVQGLRERQVAQARCQLAHAAQSACRGKGCGEVRVL